MTHARTHPNWAQRLPRRALALPVLAYRYFVSPLLGARCRFEPTCSAYALQALETHGALKGGWLAGRRLLRCHPIAFLGGGAGFDPVPPAGAAEKPSPHCPQMVHKGAADAADHPTHVTERR